MESSVIVTHFFLNVFQTFGYVKCITLQKSPAQLATHSVALDAAQLYWTDDSPKIFHHSTST